MTASITQETVIVKQSPAAAIRKRRRRAPTGGAADDCFTCAKRNVKCDRRRPYCSQCLEIGNECSGYKTQLTWGVGVASRGKLRGLSLPIAKAPPVAKEPKKSPVSRPRATSMASTVSACWRETDETRGQVRRPVDIPPIHYQGHHQSHSQSPTPNPTPNPNHHNNSTYSQSHHHSHSHSHSHGHGHHHSLSHGHGHSQHHHSTPTPPAYPIPGYDYLSMSHSGSAAPMPTSTWGSMAYSGGMIPSPDMAPRYSKFPLHISTDVLSSSVDSVGSEMDYLSPLSQTYKREEMPFSHSPTVLYDAYPAPHSSPITQSPPPVLAFDHCRAPTSYPGLVYSAAEAVPSLHAHLDHLEPHLGHKFMRDYSGLSEHHMAPLPAFPF